MHAVTNHHTFPIAEKSWKFSREYVASPLTSAHRDTLLNQFVKATLNIAKMAFKSVCTAVHEAIKVNPDGINSPFLKRLIEENKEFIAYGTGVQSGRDGDSQPETETGNADPVQPKSTG